MSLNIEKLDVQAKDGVLEIRHLTGRVADPLPLIAPQPVSLVTTIPGLISFYKERVAGKEAEYPNAVLQYSLKLTALHAILSLNPVDKLAWIVKGEILPFEDFENLQINDEKVKYSHSDLRRLLNRYKRFLEPAAWRSVMDKLENFHVKFETSFTDTDSKRGAQNLSLVRKLEQEWNVALNFNIPLFKGEEPVSVLVDIYVTLESGKPEFYLESVDLYGIADTEAKRIIKSVLDVVKFPHMQKVD